jgi:hypothetical protein
MKELPAAPRTISGKWVVLGMFGLGLVAVATIYVFAIVEIGPFEPLAKAIKAEFPTSRPHVKGGTPRDKAPQLRVVLEVDFTPVADDPRVLHIESRVVALARQHISLSDYQDFELHIVHYIPEKPPERVMIEKKVAEILE